MRTPARMLIADDNHRYGLSAQGKELFLHLAGFADIEVEKRNLVPF